METKNEKKYIYQYDTEFKLTKIHSSMVSAAKEIGISYVSIYKSITGERNLAGGYFWHRGYEPLQEIPEKWIHYIENEGKLGTKSKRIAQIDLNGYVVAEYDSIRQAAKALGIIERGISLVINGKCKTCHGYRWEVVEK